MSNRMEGREVAVGDVVQIDPDKHPKFAACFAIVEEIRSWGVIAYVPVPDQQPGTIAPIRLAWDECVAIGHAVWAQKESEDA